MDINKITVDGLIWTLDRKGYKVFLDDSKPYNLNLIGIRTKENIPDLFNDYFIIFWKYNGVFNLLKHRATMDPGLAYLGDRVGGNGGTAIVVPDQYIGLWKYGYHRGYRALQQKAPVKVLRDFNRNNKLDPEGGRIFSGIFGINGHRGKNRGSTEKVGLYSAGCIVHQNFEEFEVLMSLVRLSSEIWGNSFTFTLLEEEDFLT